jgi:hypothetical protein
MNGFKGAGRRSRWLWSRSSGGGNRTQWVHRRRFRHSFHVNECRGDLRQASSDEVEGERPNAHFVTGREVRLSDQIAGDERPVPAAQIPDGDALTLDVDLRMDARDPIAGENHVVRPRATDDVAAIGQISVYLSAAWVDPTKRELGGRVTSHRGNRYKATEKASRRQAAK